MYRLLLTVTVSVYGLSGLAQDPERPALRNNLPNGSRLFVSQTRELENPEDTAPPAPDSPPVIPDAASPGIPIPVPPVSENGDAKDRSETKVYTPMPVEEKAFVPQDPFLYQEPVPESYELPLDAHDPSFSNSYDGSVYQGNQLSCNCAPVWRSCVNDDCGRYFTASFAGFALRRSDPDSQLLSFNPINPQENLNAASHDFELNSGIEAGFTFHRLVNELDFDVRYFSVDDSDAIVRDQFLGNISRVNLVTPVDIRGPRNVTSIYSSRISNFETNFRYRYGGGWKWTSFIAGFRYVSLDESLNAQFIDPTGVLAQDQIRVNVDNDLYGIQIGMDHSLLGDRRYVIEAFWRAGIYRNSSSGGTNISAGGTPPGTFSGQGSSGQAAFVGEAGIKVRHALTDCLNVFGSFEVLFLDDVALASHQLSRTNVLTRTGHHADGDVVYHGAGFGVEYVY